MTDTATVDSQAKTNAMLAWIFAPFTSYAWKDNTDEFVKAHARSSLYLGVANIISTIVLLVLQICFGTILGALFYSNGALFGFASLLGCGWSLLGLANGAFVIVPRIVGAIKANNGEQWEVPYVNEFMAKFIKL